MMNAGTLLVPTVHEIAIAAELAISARTAEKSDTHTLPYRPALDTGTKRIDPPDELVARDARPIDGELALYRAGIRVADPTRLNANLDLPRRGRRQLPLHHVQAAGLAHLDGAIGGRHRRLLRLEYVLFGPGGAYRTGRLSRTGASAKACTARTSIVAGSGWRCKDDRAGRGDRQAAPPTWRGFLL